MIISKSRALRYLRCPRSIAYENIEFKRLNSTSVFSSSYTLEDFYTEEHNEKLLDILNSIYSNFEEENEENLLDLEKDTRNLEIYKEDYQKIEEYAQEKIKNLYGGNIIYSPYNNKLQKLFSYKVKDTDYELTSLTDIYQEDEDCIRVIEVKASTDSKIRKDIKYKPVGEKKSELLFLYDKYNDIFFPKTNDIEELPNKLFDIYNTDIGKFIYDLSFQYYTFKNSIKTDKKVKFLLAILNSEYYYDGKEIDGKKIYDCNKLITLVDLTSILEAFYPIFSNHIKTLTNDMDNCSLEAKAPLKANSEKTKPSIKCRYASLCLRDLNIPNKNSIFTYMGNHHGFIYDGKKTTTEELLYDYQITDMLDLKPNINLTRPNNICQYYTVLNKERYIDKRLINMVLKNALVYPLFHLDFESIQHPIPKFKSEKPYTQSLFQYSVHIQREKYVCDEKKDNYFYLNKDCKNDYRKEFLESLLQVLEMDEKGTIIVYNQAFEETRLKELAKVFPEYKERIEKVISRLFDLMKLLKGSEKFIKEYSNGETGEYKILFYDEKQNGSFSIKKILPLYSDRNYQEIACHNGIDAVYFFSKLISEKEIGYFEKRQNLIQYCGLDTYSMVLILDGILKEVENY